MPDTCWIIPREKFLRDVATIAERTHQPECAVIARLVAEAEQKGRRLTEPWQIAEFDQFIAAMRDEVGPALARDARSGR
jgi:hypothetical protein